jgi:hypothetical protein
MSIDHVLAVVPVSDIERSQRWYEALVGRSEDNHPMETLVEWRITETGWVQVFHDPDRAGSTLVNFAVDDLDAQAAELAARGLDSMRSELPTRVSGLPASPIRMATELPSSEVPSRF